MTNKEEFITRAKEVLEMISKGNDLRVVLKQETDSYLDEKIKRALKCLENDY